MTIEILTLLYMSNDIFKDIKKPKHWFKLKKSRLGWTPVTWQGWVVVFVYLSLITADIFLLDSRSKTVSDTLIAFFPRFMILSCFFLLVSYWTSEKQPEKEQSQQNPPGRKK
jgi:hypothetical protein